MEKQHLPFSQIIDYVRDFHDAFKVGYAREPEGRLSEAEYRLRHRLMHEENEEYLEAAAEGDLVGVADALGDQLYILCGTILKHGLQHKIVEVFEEIQRSNMSKLDANGEPIFREDGKVMKSELYFRPNIAKVINASEVEL